MLFKKFRIRNFKGIKSAEIDLDNFGQGHIFTLVGLNESGKTTVLEAINSFSPDLTAEPIFQNDVFRKIEKADLVPKHRKDNFTGDVEIEAHLEYSDADRTNIREYFERDHNLQIDLSRLEPMLKVVRRFSFDKSDYKSQGSTWWISLYTKTKKQKKYRKLSSKEEIWQSAVTYIRTLIPSICYFPTFLFEFPSRVYLSHTPEQYEPQNAYYRQIIQDILDSLGRDLTIEQHIVERVEKLDKGQLWNLFSFFQSDRKVQIDAVMNHLGNQITRSVFPRWNQIFGSRFTKNIKIEWSVDGDQKNPPVYLSFSVQDGTSTYSIAERSLGFRWFFCFLLFTQFRKSRRGSGTLFLLDEPASNLHATAQHQLLASFESVTEGNNRLIYSTHSHYMINPKWLEGAFIVLNGAIEYDNELSRLDNYQVYETDIKVTPYRRFVGENPDKPTYYQPILDALDYSPSILEHYGNAVMVEGKGDFYIFTYFKELIFPKWKDIRFLPSSGANDLGPLISLYLGWGYSFSILLDDDKAGRNAKAKYVDEWYLDDRTVQTIGDLDKNLVGKKLEDLLSDEAKESIKSALQVTKLSKKQIVRYFQDLLSRGEKLQFDSETLSNFKTTIDRAIHDPVEN